MMGKKDGQMQMTMVDIESLIPSNHFLKKIEQDINFEDKIYYFYVPAVRSLDIQPPYGKFYNK